MIPLQLQKFVTKHLGAVTGFRDISWDHGESAVFRVVSRERSAIVKGHRQRRKFRQELHAYSSWLPRLELPTGIKVPSLLAWQDAGPGHLVGCLLAGVVAAPVVLVQPCSGW